MPRPLRFAISILFISCLKFLQTQAMKREIYEEIQNGSEIDRSGSFSIPSNSDYFFNIKLPSSKYFLRLSITTDESDDDICSSYGENIMLVSNEDGRQHSPCKELNEDGRFIGDQLRYHMSLSNLPFRTIINIQFIKRIYECGETLPLSVLNTQPVLLNVSVKGCILTIPGDTYLTVEADDLINTKHEFWFGQSTKVSRIKQLLGPIQLSSESRQLEYDIFCNVGIMAVTAPLGSLVTIELDMPSSEEEKEEFRRKRHRCTHPKTAKALEIYPVDP